MLVEGALAPLFEAESVDGRYVRLERYLGYSHVLLVFLAGAKSRRCQRHLRSLAKNYPWFVEGDTEVIVVCPETAASAERRFKASSLPFPFICDPAHELAETYGQQRSWRAMGFLPAQFLICKRGIVRFVEYGRSTWDVTPPTWFLSAIRKL